MNKSAPRSVLVVGGAGYIGSHMVLALRDAGHRVTVFDNLCRGFAAAVPEGVTLLRGDLGVPADIQRAFEGSAFDMVMHFAAFAYVGESVNEPEIYYANNVAGSLNLMAAMRRAGQQNLVFSSTCATYGEPTVLPIPESHPQRPINPYGRSKWMVEQMLIDQAHAHGLRSVSLRYFNASGADPQGRAGERHDPETHLIPLVLQEALRLRRGGQAAHTTLKVFGSDLPTPDGSCVRDYIHVSDLSQAHLRAAERLWSGQVQGAEFYNLANGAGFSVLEVIRACSEVTGQAITWQSLPRRAGDPAVLVGDANRAREVLGWVPQYGDLHELVQHAWAWMLAHEAAQ
jgi:UDP-glucose-4-epimerase GalE